MAAAWPNDDRDLVRLAAFVRSLGRVEPEALPGDPARGRALFEGKGACTACHIVRGVGTGLGPDLSEIGAERGAAHLRQALLEPGASRPEEMIPFEPRSLSAYLVVTVVTRDGRTIAGYRVNEDAFTIQLREADGGLVSLRKGELASLRKDPDRSPMPGYGDLLAPAESGGPRGVSRQPRRGVMGRSTRTSGSVIAVLVALASGSAAQVPFDRLRRAGSEPGSWLTYSGTYAGHRFSSLAEITPANVARLRPAWVYQAREAGPVETTPLVADGVMYVTEARSRVAALDVRTGRTLWRYEPQLPKDVKTLGFPPVNRGVALLDDRVFVGTLDARLVALDALSGAVRWTAPVADNALGYAITSAPLAIDGKVVIGVSGGEAGIRGFLDAYDAKTGERLWRFHTIPGPGEPGHDTWAGDSWKTGGGATWLTGAYDPELNLLYWGVGNPAPDWNGDVARRRQPLHLLARRARRADRDAAVALPVHARTTRTTGTPTRCRCSSTPRSTAGRASWSSPRTATASTTCSTARPASSSAGRPTRSRRGRAGSTRRAGRSSCPAPSPRRQGTLVWPSLQGAAELVQPLLRLRERARSTCAVREMGSLYFKSEAEYEPGKLFMGGGEAMLPGAEAYGAVRALDALTGERRWEYRLLSPPCGRACWPRRAGSCSAARTKATSSRSTPRPGSRCGTSRRAAPASPTRSLPGRRAAARGHRVRPGGVRVRAAVSGLRRGLAHGQAVMS